MVCMVMSRTMRRGGDRAHRENSPCRDPEGHYRGTVGPPVTTAEIAALLAVAQDHAFAQPAGAQLRATVLGQHLAGAAGLDVPVRETAWWTSALRFLGCTGHAFDMAVV